MTFVFATSSRRWRRVAILSLIVFAFGVPMPIEAQETERHKRALELYEAQNFVAAIPLLEAEAAEHPNSAFILSRLGFALYAVSETEKDSGIGRKMRDRAREVLLKSKSLGDDSNLTKITLDALSHPMADDRALGGPGAEAAVREGEAAFVRGDMDAAFASYKKALEMNPRLYEAALFAGDSLFKKALTSTDPDKRHKLFDEAGIWFGKAVAIDPNRETAYRYWGDALDGQGKIEAARDKFVEAIVADPSSERAYMGLTQWGQRHRVRMGHPVVEIPANVSSLKPGEINISVADPASKDDGGAAWLVYALTRGSWANTKTGLSDKFAKAYPGEKEYRHSLAEEVDALKLTAQSVSEQLKGKKVSQLHPSLATLMRLHEADLIEPFIFFAKADRGIVRDYAAYRTTNREKLKQYWLQMVITKVEPKGYN